MIWHLLIYRIWLAFKLIHEMLVCNLLLCDILLTALIDRLLSTFATHTELANRRVCSHISELGRTIYLSLWSVLAVFDMVIWVHMLCISRWWVFKLLVAHMMIWNNRHFATIIISTSLATKRWFWLFINHHFLVCDVYKWLHNVAISFALSCWFFVPGRVHMSTRWIIQACLWGVYDSATFSRSSVVFSMRWVVFWLFWTLARPGVCAHGIWEFALALSNDFQRLFVLDEERGFFTVWSDICYCIDTCDGLIGNCTPFNIIDMVSVIDNVWIRLDKKIIWWRMCMLRWGGCRLLHHDRSVSSIYDGTLMMMHICLNLLWCHLIEIFIHETTIVVKRVTWWLRGVRVLLYRRWFHLVFVCDLMGAVIEWF